MRLFVGIALPPELRQRTAQLLSKCARSGANVRWVKPANLHLTLRFLGETDPGALDSLRQALSRVAGRIAPLRLELGGYGAFPRLERPRVLFIPVRHGGEALAALAQQVAIETGALGFPAPEEEFHPHLTLGRSRERRPDDAAVRELHAVAPDRLGSMKVDRFHLFESRANAQGREYVPLDEFLLARELL